ncbi:MAG: histidine kinase, partial [Anaerolineae bacterium]
MANTHLNKRSSSSIQRFALTRWLQRYGLNIERQLQLVQWALPLILTIIVLVDEITEHIIGKHESLLSENFLNETIFFGVLGPAAVWLVLYWVRGMWSEREQDRQLLQQMYDELAQTQQNLEELHTQRGNLLNRLMTVQEEERRRLAREIHDEMGQLLTGLSLNLKICQEAVPADFPAVHDRLARTNTLVQHTIEQAHRLMVDLRPAALDDYGLVPALRDELNQRLKLRGLTVNFKTGGNVDHLPPDVTTAVFRISQEAITNIIRHAGAQQVWLHLQQTGPALQVIIEDDGLGLNQKPETTANGYQPLGILGMQERAAALGGR